MGNVLLNDEKKITAWLKKHKIKNYDLVPDSTYGFVVNVQQDVKLNLNTKKGPSKILVKFNQVVGNFTCSDNFLDSLDFAPFTVSGNFNASFNEIKNFEDSPLLIVNGECNLSCNKLETLINSPQKVFSLLLNHNNLSSLDGISPHINKKLNLSNNPLPSLKGMPEYVGEYFNCSFTNIKNLEHFPKSFSGEFVCEQNHSLTSLKGITKVIHGNLYLNNNPLLASFEFGPTRITGKLTAEGNNFSSLLFFPKVDNELLIRYNLGLGKYQDITSYDELEKIIAVFNEQHNLSSALNQTSLKISQPVVKV